MIRLNAVSLPRRGTSPAIKRRHCSSHDDRPEGIAQSGACVSSQVEHGVYEAAFGDLTLTRVEEPLKESPQGARSATPEAGDLRQSTTFPCQRTHITAMGDED